MASNTMNNGNGQRKQLSTQLDRLDTILDGLAVALNESVADAVKDVVGQVVKETVESTIKEVLSNPDLLRSALAQHVPQQALKPKRSLKDVLKGCLAALYQKACDTASGGKKGVSRAWSWCVEKVKRGFNWCCQRCRNAASNCATACKTAGSLFRLAWNFPRTTTIALTVGLVVGVGAYLAGPVVASSICAVSSAAMTAVGKAMWPLARLVFSSSDA